MHQTTAYPIVPYIHPRLGDHSTRAGESSYCRIGSHRYRITSAAESASNDCWRLFAATSNVCGSEPRGYFLVVLMTISSVYICAFGKRGGVSALVFGPDDRRRWFSANVPLVSIWRRLQPLVMDVCIIALYTDVHALVCLVFHQTCTGDDDDDFIETVSARR